MLQSPMLPSRFPSASLITGMQSIQGHLKPPSRILLSLALLSLSQY
jgi:hypothetical protein